VANNLDADWVLSGADALVGYTSQAATEGTAAEFPQGDYATDGAWAPCEWEEPPVSFWELEYDSSATQGNPHKGLFTSTSWTAPEDFALDASLDFHMVPVADCFVGMSKTPDFGLCLDPLLEAAAEDGLHVVYRFYLDAPTMPTGMPAFLIEGHQFDAYTDYGGGQSPDYHNETLISFLVDFVTALGTATDGDTRVHQVQLGLLGFWGEWHTFPHDTWFPTQASIDRILAAFLQAFNKTPMSMRIPDYCGDDMKGVDATGQQLGFGFHDDSFAYSTLSTDPANADFFWPSMQAHGFDEQWRWNAQGGEIR
jgi:hypothetical protein